MQQLALGMWFAPYFILGCFTGFMYMSGSSPSDGEGYTTYMVVAALHLVGVLPLIRMWRNRRYKDDAAEVSGMAMMIGCVCSWLFGLVIGLKVS